MSTTFRFASCWIQRTNCWVICFLLSCLLPMASAFGQEEIAEQKVPEFAPGVLTTIEPDLDPADTVSKHPIVELRAQEDLQREPALMSSTRTLYEMAEQVDFRREVWCLEFTFKPLRMMHVDIPQPSGRMQRKLVWYLVYRVRNTGAALAPQQEEDGTFTTVEQPAGPQRFVPQFLLTSMDRNRQGEPLNKSYLDRILPVAIEAIEQREFRGGKLLNSSEMSTALLQPEEGREVGGFWGVATWVDLDPRIDFFSVFVQGLTNGYRWSDVEEFPVGAAPGTGRTFERKMLQLNFWRPGDDIDEDEREIRFGAAPGKAHYYGSSEGVAYEWVFR